LAAVLMGGLWLSGSCPLAAQVNVDASVQANLEAGQQALATRNYEAALERWQQGLEDVQAWGATQYEATYYFKLGLVWQAWGEAALREGNDELARDRLRRAELEYQTLLEHTPSSAGTYNNLARVYDQMGRINAATDAYEQAVAVEDVRQPLFTLNYADFLRRQGRNSAAIGYYQRVLEARPENTRALEGLAEAYWATDRPALIGYMWDLIYGGREVRALDIALDKLATSEWTGTDTVIEQQKTALLTCVVMGLSLGSYAPEAFLESDRARLLTELSGSDRHIGRGAREILLLHRPEASAEASFDWWATRGNLREDPPPGWIWPREAFRRLIRARGAWYQEQGHVETAQTYYLLSIRLPGEDTDPEALLHLAKMYFRAGTPERIDRLMNQYAEALFSGKATAYRKAQWAKAYDYHRTLGVMYAYLKRWGDASTPTSAIFQLEEARKDAARYNEAAGSSQRIRVEPQMIDYLAEGYEATNKPRAAMVVRLEAAEVYERQGDRESRIQVLKPLESRSLPADLQVRYERLQRRDDRG
jgi:tetratricopeptide (TPR) repeat protein